MNCKVGWFETGQQLRTCECFLAIGGGKPAGMGGALGQSMAGWTSVEEIKAYVMSRDLRDRIHDLVDNGPAARDFDFAGQIRKSSSSAPANISEGFDRYYHGEFGYLASVAKASLAETINHLEEPRAKKYFPATTRKELLELAIRAKKATSGLLRHLLTSDAPGEQRRPKRRRRATNRR
jgi:four helix bundle protein